MIKRRLKPHHWKRDIQSIHTARKERRFQAARKEGGEFVRIGLRRETRKKRRNTTEKGGNSRYVCCGFLFVFMIFVLHLLFLLLVYRLFVWLRITMVASLSIADHQFECMFYFC